MVLKVYFLFFILFVNKFDSWNTELFILLFFSSPQISWNTVLCQWIPFYSRTLHCWLSKWFTLTSVTIRSVLQITPIQIWAGKLWKRTFKQWWSTIQSIWRKRITFHLLHNNILWKIKIDIPGKHSSMHMQFTYLKWVGDYYLMPSEQLISHIIARSYKWLCEEMMRLSALY